MPTSLLASAAVAGGSMLFNKLTANDKDPLGPLQQFTPPGIKAGGLTGTFGGSTFDVAASPERMGLVGGIANTFGNQADLISGLRDRVTPGASDLRAARLAEIENARTASVGNLRDNLARRRVLGSSFAQDAVTRAESEFAQQKERVQAESFMQEMELTNNLIQQEFTARRAAFQTGLDELNLEAQIATSLAGKATDIMGKNAQMEAQLLALGQQGAGKFFGQEIAPGIKSGVNSLFSGGGGGGDAAQLASGKALINSGAFVGPTL